MTTTSVSMQKNSEHKGIELYFQDKPSEQVRTELKNTGYRWHKTKKCWYAKEGKETLKLAKQLCSIDIPLDESVIVKKSEPAQSKKKPAKTAPVFVLHFGWGKDEIVYQVKSFKKDKATIIGPGMTEEKTKTIYRTANDNAYIVINGEKALYQER